MGGIKYFASDFRFGELIQRTEEVAFVFSFIEYLRQGTSDGNDLSKIRVHTLMSLSRRFLVVLKLTKAGDVLESRCFHAMVEQSNVRCQSDDRILMFLDHG